MQVSQSRLNAALLIIRLGVGAFLGVWASLKFLRPEWMVNVFRNTYKQDWVIQDHAFIVGALQMLIVVLFVLGIWRTVTYAFVTVIHATGVLGTLLGGNLLFKGGLIKALTTGQFSIGYVNFPSNLLWTSVATLAALITLFILRHHDGWTFDGLKRRRY